MLCAALDAPHRGAATAFVKRLSLKLFMEFSPARVNQVQVAIAEALAKAMRERSL
jgi:hypothetical protein